MTSKTVYVDRGPSTRSMNTNNADLKTGRLAGNGPACIRSRYCKIGRFRSQCHFGNTPKYIPNLIILFSMTYSGNLLASCPPPSEKLDRRLPGRLDYDPPAT